LGECRRQTKKSHLLIIQSPVRLEPRRSRADGTAVRRSFLSELNLTTAHQRRK
jgi:hypothetical protein